jgi:hypothetical protein
MALQAPARAARNVTRSLARAPMPACHPDVERCAADFLALLDAAVGLQISRAWGPVSPLRLRRCLDRLVQRAANQSNDPTLRRFRPTWEFSCRAVR